MTRQSQAHQPPFQHTAARRRLGRLWEILVRNCCFNTQPPEGGWAERKVEAVKAERFQHTAARRRLGQVEAVGQVQILFQHTAARRRLEKAFGKYHSNECFNTQPPEGGWPGRPRGRRDTGAFQHTAARRRLGLKEADKRIEDLFQHTAARRRLGVYQFDQAFELCFNTQPPEGGWKDWE